MLDGDKRAVVEYTTSYKNVTPFSKISRVDLKAKSSHKVNLSLYDDGWRLEE
jgi:hypothetical protein